jgi:hypothetical protein
VGMSGSWRCLGKHRVTWDLASLSPVQVGLLPKCALLDISSKAEIGLGSW